MNAEIDHLKRPARSEGRLGFVADLSFLLCTTWLVLWRTEVSGAPRGSLWVSWWPALALGVLIVVASIVGLTQRKPRGFLPYALRWAFLAVLLVLPAWLAISLADASARSLNLRSAAVEARQDATQMLAVATRPEQKEAQQQVVDATAAGLKLLDSLDEAKARGVELPRVDLGSLLSAADIDKLDPDAVETLETVLGVADTIDSGDELAGDLSDIMHSLGLDDPMVQMAIIGLLAAVIAPALGLSPELILQVLQALVIDGQLSLGGLLRVVPALLGSIGPEGLDSAAFSQKIEQNGEKAGDFVTMLHAIEARGGDEVRRSELFQSVKQIAVEASGGPSGGEPDPCPKAAIVRARKASGGQDDAFLDQLRKACPDMSPAEIREIRRTP